jgi:hypothetical protein
VHCQASEQDDLCLGRDGVTGASGSLGLCLLDPRLSTISSTVLRDAH